MEPASSKPPWLKPMLWMGDSLKVLRGFPAAVREEIGYALYLAQAGNRHLNAKPMKGLGPGVLEVVSDHRGDTYRAVYTLRLAGRIYVLHVFQKKSKRGVETPKSEIDLVKHRLKRAIELPAAREE